MRYLRRIGFPAEDIGKTRIFHGPGCDDCRQSGYQGVIPDELSDPAEFEALLRVKQKNRLLLLVAALSSLAGWLLEDQLEDALEENIDTTFANAHFTE